MTSRFALAASLSLVLSACGSPAEEGEEPSGAEAVSTADVSAPAVEPTGAPTDAETPAAEATEAATATPTPTATATAVATATAAAGSPPDSFKQCAVCHKTEPGGTGIGPTLAGVFGARAGHVAGFNYSDAMEESGLTWNQATLDRYLANPQGVVPGTTMAFAGVKDAAKRAEIIAYLKTL